MPPEELRIATRVTGTVADSAQCGQAREILEMIDCALDEHAEWLAKWHRAIVCILPPDPEIVSEDLLEHSRFGDWLRANTDRGLTDQPAFHQLRDAFSAFRAFGRRLAIAAADGKRPTAGEYDAFNDHAERFVSTARRVRDAFQRVAFDIDPLTGVHNRHSMSVELERERERCRRTGNALCVCLCDIDRFKAVNDAHGHLAGDNVLLAVAGRLIANLRPYDRIYRFGGDEFLLAFADADEGRATAIANRLCGAVRATDVRIDNSTVLSVTASFGVCAADPAESLQATLRRADEALYRAKREGRNRVVLWRETDGTGREG